MPVNKLYSVFLIALWSIFGATVYVILWELNKGFEFTDEGFNMLSFMKGQEDILKIRPIYSFIANLTDPFNPGIFFFRLFRLLLLLFSSFVFSFGFISWCRAVLVLNPAYSLAFFHPVIATATLMSYAIFCQILSYNSLTLFFVQLIAGLFLPCIAIIKQKDRNSRKSQTLYFLIFFLCGFLFITKYPTAILFSLLLIVLLLILEISKGGQNRRLHVSNLIAGVAGFVFFLIVITFSLKSPLTIIKEIHSGSQYIVGHDPKKLFEMYLEDFYQNFILIVIYHPVIIIGPFIIWIGLRYAWHKFLILSSLIIFAFLIKDAFSNNYYQSGTAYFFIASAIYKSLIWFSLLLILLIISDKKTRLLIGPGISNLHSTLAGLLLLLVIPFICSIGTTSALSIHITQFIFPWITLFIFVLLVVFSKVEYSKYLLMPVTLLVVINASAQIINGSVFSTYRSNIPLTEQHYTVPELPIDNHLKFDLKTSIFLKEIVAKLKSNNALVKDQPIISLYNFPGLTYLLNGLSPGNAWYIDDGYPGNTKTNCVFIKESKMKNLDKTVILLEEDYKIPFELITCLKKKGIDFKENYFKADSVIKPNETKKLFIYLPLNLKK